jgi:hypothetical protein
MHPFFAGMDWDKVRMEPAADFLPPESRVRTGEEREEREAYDWELMSLRQQVQDDRLREEAEAAAVAEEERMAHSGG